MVLGLSSIHTSIFRLSILLGLFLSGNAFACSCVDIKSKPAQIAVPDEVKLSDVVFVGKAAKVTLGIQGFETQEVEFEVLESFKGVHSKVFTTKTVVQCCLCGMSVVQGKTYLIYAVGSASEGFDISSCSRSAEVDKASADLEILRRSAPTVTPLPD
jgi:hypothetical protein